MTAELLIAPTTTPVSVADIKDHLKLDSADTSEDTLLQYYLEAAVEQCQNFARRKFMKQTWRVLFDHWPHVQLFHGFSPALAFTSVKYLDEQGVEKTLGASLYSTDLISTTPRISFFGSTPGLSANALNRVRVEMVCGYADGDEAVQKAAVPDRVKAAILLQAARLYQSREDVNVNNNNMVKASENLLWSLRSAY